MPELPEVETVLRGLRQRAVGRRITQVEVHHAGVIVGTAEEFAKAVSGRVIAALRRKGKALGLELRAKNGAAARFLLVRLGMTGQFVVMPRAAPLENHTHVRMVLDDGRDEIRYRDVRRFGRLRCCTAEELEAVFARLGPDAPDIREEEFLAALLGRRGAIKSWLMNQQFLAGLGNIYADEALYAARIHPLTQAGRLSPPAARTLLRAMKRVLARALHFGGTSFRDYLGADGEPGEFLEKLNVYQRTGERCRRCRTQIRRIVVTGRSSHFCPRCQPRPRQPARMHGPRKPLPPSRRRR
ncbi:MAG: bifunctional DNA-formamidopyrimidine glycosylase/DNA-(apurinic or apyrimidinic site) lyase [Acidobacteriia bacterium]|nr:bifunctional DNA-formamidopyrimidine glycosylase/DNA-(apurinic or apyrimidinic site) lyase [Terriglobia bacterium]